jgi:hypothetical protein
VNVSLALFSLVLAANLYTGLALVGISHVRSAGVALLGAILALLLVDPLASRLAGLDLQLLRAICGI